MDFKETLSNIGDSISDVAKNVGSKAMETKDIVVLKNKKATEERNIKSLYQEIGKLYYEKYGNDEAAEWTSQMRRINSSKNKIAELDEEIKKVKSQD
ncbi:MAG: hypothetical protein II699_01610 [Lachnospiraceae bacterium]|nr:hypothetical protein [Lachnospiraceae bacterium]